MLASEKVNDDLFQKFNNIIMRNGTVTSSASASLYTSCMLIIATLATVYSFTLSNYDEDYDNVEGESSSHTRNLGEGQDDLFNVTLIYDEFEQIFDRMTAPSLFPLKPSDYYGFLFAMTAPSLFPLKPSDYYGFLFAIAGLMVAAGGGIGGGGILVPIYILVMGFSTKHAIPLSNITVVGGSLANTWLDRNRRHPYADRPVIDWDLNLILIPSLLLGTLIGAFVNKLLPEITLNILLVLLLTVMAHTTLKKAVELYHTESLELTASTSELTPLDSESTERKVTDGVDNYESIEVNDNEQSDLERILEEERHTPYRNVCILCVTFGVVLIVNLAKGGGAFPSPFGITCGSVSFWLSNLFLVVWIISIQTYLWYYFVNRHHFKVASGYQYLKGDIQWDETNTSLFPLVSGMAGFFAGMFGIGGGIVTAPVMLAMGVHPEVNAASTACRILFTSLTATTSFIVFGLLIPDYGAVCFVIGFAATYIGNECMHYYMKRFGRNSVIAFSIGIVILLSAILVTLESILKILSGNVNHPRGICDHDDL